MTSSKRRCMHRRGAAPSHRIVVLVVTGLVMLASTNSSMAAGFYLSSIGTPISVGSAGVGNVVNNVGPDAAWANPAGLTGIKRPTILAGATLIAPFAEWDEGVSEAGGTEGSNTGQPAVVPSLAYAQPLTDKWSFGFAFSALQGGGVDYGDAFVGRYAATEVLLQGVGATWSFGWQATDKLALGFGGSLVYTQFEQKIAINQSAVAPGTPDAKAEFKDLDDLGIQPILGLQYQLTDRWLLGLSWRGEFDAELDGNIRLKNLAPVVPIAGRGNLEIDWTNPQWVEAGFQFEVKPDRFLMFSMNWQEWSEFSSNQLSIDASNPAVPPIGVVLDRQFDDTWGVGIAYGVTQGIMGEGEPASGWIFGASYETSPVSDGKRTIDLPFDENIRLSTGYFRHGKGKYNWSVQGQLQIFGDNRVDQTAQGARFSGEFDDFIVAFLSATLRFNN